MFIVGYPRSGSSLLQALLATQPGLVSLPETHFFTTLRRVCKHGADLNIRPDSLPDVIEAINAATGISLGLEHRSMLERGCADGRLTAKLLFEVLVEHLLQRSTGDGYWEQRWIEKTPGHVFHMYDIAELYPAAQFVAIVRHPAAATASRRDNLPGESCFSLDELACRWCKTCRVIDNFAHAVPERLRLVRYEDLVADHEQIVKQLCGFLRVAFDSEALTRYPLTAEALAYPWEVWKAGIKDPRIRDANADKLRNIRLFDLLRVQSIAGWQMRDMGYEPTRRELQRLYNLWRRICRCAEKSSRKCTLY